MHYYKGEYDTSLRYNQKALAIGNLLRDSLLINNGYNNIGLLYYDLGSYQTALEYLLRSKLIKDRVGETYGYDLVLNNIGLVYLRVSRINEARRNFFEAFDMAIFNRNQDVQVYSLNNIGITYLEEGTFDMARQYFDSAMRVAQRIGNVNWGAVSLRSMGEIMRYEGKYDSAIYYYDKSLEACISIGERKGIAETFAFMAKLFLDQGDVNTATEYLNLSHEVATKLRIRYQLLQNLRLYASIFLVERDNQKVIQNQIKYLDLRDSLFRDVMGKNLELIPIKIKEEEDRIRLANQQAELKLKSFNNKIYFAILAGALPFIAFLIILLRKNRLAYKELKINNEELKRTQNLLVTSEKMASLGVLAAGVAHEINNPLNYIKNGVKALMAKMSKSYSKANEDLKEYFTIIDEGVDRASKIVSSLSHFSRVGFDEDEYCRVEDIIDNCLLILNNKLKRIEVEKRFSKTPAVVHGNEGKLHQAFMNIISNAEQAVNGNGKITISTEAQNGKMMVTIKDNGSGISKENLIKISDPFFTTKPPGEGTGLGLFITYAIIEEHHGDIQVNSEPNNGAEFIVTLPLYSRN